MLLRFIALGAVCCLAGCATARTGATSGKAVATGFTACDDVIFTPATWPAPLQADIYQPKGEGPWPAVLLIYGGSWSGADHRWQMRLLARKLAARGYVVMNAAYRGTPEFRYPAPIEDLREALRWLRAHAGEYRVNPERIASYGFSAGGHLAAFLGTQDAPPETRVQAVVAASAPTDLALYPGGKILPRFLGATYAEKPELFHTASPISYVSAGDPPVFLYHGSGDTTVSPEHSRVFKAALDRAGVRNELREVDGRGHAMNLILSGDAEDAAIDFLDSVLR